MTHARFICLESNQRGGGRFFLCETPPRSSLTSIIIPNDRQNQSLTDLLADKDITEPFQPYLAQLKWPPSEPVKRPAAPLMMRHPFSVENGTQSQILNRLLMTLCRTNPWTADQPILVTARIDHTTTSAFLIERDADANDPQTLYLSVLDQTSPQAKGHRLEPRESYELRRLDDDTLTILQMIPADALTAQADRLERPVINPRHYPAANVISAWLHIYLAQILADFIAAQRA
jgi:hypothetical protein